MKTYLNYLAYKLKKSWNEDHSNILMPIWMFLVFAVPTVISVVGTFYFNNMLFLPIALAFFALIFSLPWLPDWIKERVENYKAWRDNTSVSDKESQGVSEQ